MDWLIPNCMRLCLCEGVFCFWIRVAILMEYNLQARGDLGLQMNYTLQILVISNKIKRSTHKRRQWYCMHQAIISTTQEKKHSKNLQPTHTFLKSKE
jgi:hypothetical protein